MALVVNSRDVPEQTARPDMVGDSPPPAFQMVHGQSGSIVYGARPPGYHSMPHTHDREQFNYQIDGEIWLFVDGKGYLLKPGDFSRVPANAVHWAWNRSDTPTTMIEFHVPGQQDAEQLEGMSLGLFDEGETDNHVETPPTIFVDPAEYNFEEIETAAIAAYEAEHAMA